MTAVPIGTETAEAAETGESSETAEMTEAKKYQPQSATGTPGVTETEAIPETDQPSLDTQAVTEEPPATEAQTDATEYLRSLATICIGCNVSDLYNLIGYPPNGSHYEKSNNSDPNVVGEDGELYYEGFTVYTYRENGVESVRGVSS